VQSPARAEKPQMRPLIVPSFGHKFGHKFGHEIGRASNCKVPARFFDRSGRHPAA